MSHANLRLLDGYSREILNYNKFACDKSLQLFVQ